MSNPACPACKEYGTPDPWVKRQGDCYMVTSPPTGPNWQSGLTPLPADQCPLGTPMYDESTGNWMGYSTDADGPTDRQQCQDVNTCPFPVWGAGGWVPDPTTVNTCPWPQKQLTANPQSCGPQGCGVGDMPPCNNPATCNPETQQCTNPVGNMMMRRGSGGRPMQPMMGKGRRFVSRMGRCRVQNPDPRCGGLSTTCESQADCYVDNVAGTRAHCDNGCCQYYP